MTYYTQLPSIDALKQQAKHLRASLASDGKDVTHSASLELIATQYGMRDWNTLYAAVGNRRLAPFNVGARIKGRYLGHAFDGEVLGVQALSGGRTRVTLDLDEPVDVVTFDSFSAYRQRITATINGDGASTEKTSDGVPHMVVEAIL